MHHFTGLSECCVTSQDQEELKQLMTAILYRKKLEKSKYGALIDKFIDSVPEMCDDLKIAYGLLHNMPELNHEHLMYAHAAGCIGQFSLNEFKSHYIFSAS